MKRISFFAGVFLTAALVVWAANALLPEDLIGFTSVQSIAQTAVVAAIGMGIGGLIMMMVANYRRD